MLIPLLLTVKDYRGKMYKIFLMLKDENKATISSHLYEPEYLIRKGIIIKDIRPLVILEEEKNVNLNSINRHNVIKLHCTNA